MRQSYNALISNNSRICSDAYGEISHLVTGNGLSLDPSDDAGKFDAIDEFHKAYMLRG